MQPYNDDICRLVQDIWLTLLSLDYPPTPMESAAASDDNFLTGCVQIVGAWEGAVALRCSAKLGRQAAALMLGSDAPSSDDIRDAVAELTNITAGNFKSLLPGPCEISLPSVVEGKDYRLTIPGTSLVNQVLLGWQGEPLEIMVLRRDDASRKGTALSTAQVEDNLHLELR